LVEAKARVDEIMDKKERKHGRVSTKSIVEAFEKTQRWLGIAPSGEAWRRSPYYQHANRLAALYYLRQERDIAAVFAPLYLCGDKYPGKPRGDNLTSGDYCPMSGKGWARPIAEMNDALGLTGVNKASYGIREVFLDVVRVEPC